MRVRTQRRHFHADAKEAGSDDLPHMIEIVIILKAD